MLRQGMLRLSKPTGEAAKILKDMGVNVFDADENMKSLDKVVAELEKGMDGYSKKQKAAALATIFGSESTAGWTVLLDQGSDTLKEYTVELENSEGAAKDMADTMQDNAEGAIVRMQSALSGMKIELGEKLLPTLGKGADMIGDFANKLSEMDESTVQTIAETALLVTAILGVTTAVAGLVAGIGAFMAFAGPVGAAIAAGTLLIGGLGAAAYKTQLETDKLNEVNLDTASSLTDQAIELEKNTNLFDKLSEKAKISNAELAELYSLNKQIGEGGSSEEIAKLQSQYDELAKKSGLSKDELEKLFGANEYIIEQSPQVEKSITEQGDAFVYSTEKVKEHIASLYEASKVELFAEREKQLKEQVRLQEELDKKQRQYNSSVEALNLADDIRKLNREELLDLDAQLTEKQNEAKQGSEEWLALDDERTVVNAALNGKAEEYYLTQLETTQEKREALATTKEELAEVEAINSELANVWLKQVGINEEDEKGLIKLNEKLAKNEEKLGKLDAELEKNGQLTTEQQEQYHELQLQNDELSETQDYLNNELELYGSVNSLVESKRHLLSDSTNEKIKELEKTHEIEVAEGNIIEQLQKKQQKLVEEREQLEKNREKQGANKEEIDKQIEATNKKINLGDEAILSILQELDALELVKDGIELNSSELESFLINMGYTVDEAAELAAVLVGDTIAEMEDGVDKAEKAGADTTDGYSQGVASGKGKSEDEADKISVAVRDKFGLYKSEAEKHGEEKSDAVNKGLGSKKGNILKTTSDITNSLLKDLGKGDADANKSGQSKGEAVNTGLFSTKGGILSTSGGIISSLATSLGSASDGGGGRKAGSDFTTGLRNRQGSARSAGSGVATSGRGGLASVSTYGTGQNFTSGFNRGIGSISVWNTAWSIGKSALSALNSAIKTASPSKETEQSGGWFTEGFSNAIDDGTKEAIAKSKEMGQQSLAALSGEIDGHKHSFAKISTGIEQGKQSLKVEHELSGRFDEFTRLLRQSNDKEGNFIKDLLSATLEQNNILMQLLQKNPNIVMNDRVLGTEIEPIISEIQNRNKRTNDAFK